MSFLEKRRIISHSLVPYFKKESILVNDNLNYDAHCMKLVLKLLDQAGEIPT